MANKAKDTDLRASETVEIVGETIDTRSNACKSSTQMTYGFSPGEIRLQARTFRDELQKATAPIITRINDWLSQIEGRHFECQDAKDVVDEIRETVHATGCELLFDNQRVSIRVQGTESRIHAAIHLTTTGVSKRKTIWSKSAFPLLKAEPANAHS